MKKILAVVLICFSLTAFAKGSFSGGGGFRSGGFSSSRSFSSGSFRPSTPSYRPSQSTSSYTPSQSYSKPGYTQRPATSNYGGATRYTAPQTYTSRQAPVTSPRTTTTTTSTASVTRNSYRNYGGSGYYGPSAGMYGGFGMGYHYNNGLLTGLIIGNMMHPAGTVMYTGPGAYANNALLYPNGQVVAQDGHLVGNYQGGQFAPVDGGAMVAQPAPAPMAQPAVVVDATPTWVTVLEWTLGAILIAVILALIFL